MYADYILSAGLEFFFALISLILLFGCLLDHDRKRKINRLMIAILAVHTTMNAIDACIWIWCDVPELQLLMKIFSFLSYALGSATISMFSLLLVTYIREITPVPRWIVKLIYAVSLLMGVLWFLSLFNNMYYYWDESGVCQQGDWFWLSQAFGILFFLSDILLVIAYRKHLGSKDTSVFMLYSTLPLLSFFLIPYWDVTPLYMATTIVLLLYYIILHAEHGQRIAEQETLLVKQELDLMNSRTAIVLSQIRPHFLYNSLTAIAQLCEQNPKQAKETTLNFSEYLRRNMSSLDEQNPVPFEQELKHVKTYLSIEQIRFGDFLHVTYQIDTMNFFLPPLTLQPIVENAVKHGIGMKEDGGFVAIFVRETPDVYEITVKDDGVGFDKNRDIFDDKKHIGMRLVRIRVEKMVHGSMHVESSPGVGTTVTICIPKENAETGDSKNEYYCR